MNLKKIWDTVTTVLVVLVVIFAVFLMGSRLMGLQVFNVISGSMEPTYSDGDIVLVEKCATLDVGEIGIFTLNGDVYIKELGEKCLISHNTAYKPIKIGEADSIYLSGRVIGVVEEVFEGVAK